MKRSDALLASGEKRQGWIAPKDQCWIVYEAEGRFVTEKVDEEVARRANSPLEQKRKLEKKRLELEEQPAKARLELAQSQRGLRSLFTRERRR